MFSLGRSCASAVKQSSCWRTSSIRRSLRSPTLTTVSGDRGQIEDGIGNGIGNGIGQIS